MKQLSLPETGHSAPSLFFCKISRFKKLCLEQVVEGELGLDAVCPGVAF